MLLLPVGDDDHDASSDTAGADVDVAAVDIVCDGSESVSSDVLLLMLLMLMLMQLLMQLLLMLILLLMLTLM